MSDDTKTLRKKRRLGRIAVFLIRTINSTLRLEVRGWERYKADDQKLIICGWHGKSFIFVNFFRNRRYWVIISESNDGDIQDLIFRRLGFQSIRGSTGRGGVKAALQSIKTLKAGGSMAISPDGPRGPAKEVQGGVMMMAQKSGAALVPIGMSSKWAWYARKSWDNYMVPMPFSRARILLGDPIYVPEDADAETVERTRLHLQAEIERMEQEASFGS